MQQEDCQRRRLKLKGENAVVEVEVNDLGLSSKPKPFVVVGIPALNEENSIGAVIVRAQEFASEVIVCDDGSKDLTATISERLGAQVIRHNQNLGYGSALKSLFERARDLGADALVTLDADGQHDPAEIPRLIKPIASGSADVVVGSRFVKGSEAEEMPLHRQVGVKVITLMTNGFGKGGVRDAQSGFRAYSSSALDSLVFSEKGMGASVEILLKTNRRGLKTCEVPISCKYINGNGVKSSKENAINQGVGVVMSLIRLIVEERPLVYLGAPGILCFIVGAFFGVWMMQIYAIEQRIVTNIALASVSFILVGFFALSTAITLYAITRMAKKSNGS